MDFDAIVLAGGRGSRVGGAAKVLGQVNGATLLRRALDAGVGARRTVVVGPPSLATHIGTAALVREEPPFGGPVAAIAAGCAALPEPAEWTLVLAADHVDPAAAVAAVLGSAAAAVLESAAADAAAADAAAADGAMAVDDGRDQYLLAVYRSGSLRAALAAMPTVDGVSVRTLTQGLRLHRVAVPAGAARDVDTPDDAATAGVTLPRTEPPSTATPTPRTMDA
ncbi:NTP transferase domain-containing protein [Microbacteriaceae bacterium VKM Ac-2854]|nr:NTP transferase domain-containing protein [Microbacteriaceae bacterium VKM Ac-2854]